MSYKFICTVSVLYTLEKYQKNIFLDSLSLVILPKLQYTYVNIYNGKTYKLLYITPSMIGKKLGQFIQTKYKKTK